MAFSSEHLVEAWHSVVSTLAFKSEHSIEDQIAVQRRRVESRFVVFNGNWRSVQFVGQFSA